jgi:hypothetical protein
LRCLHCSVFSEAFHPVGFDSRVCFRARIRSSSPSKDDTNSIARPWGLETIAIRKSAALSRLCLLSITIAMLYTCAEIRRSRVVYWKEMHLDVLREIYGKDCYQAFERLCEMIWTDKSITFLSCNI